MDWMTYDEECDENLGGLAPSPKEDLDASKDEVCNGRVDKGAVQGHLGHSRRDAMAISSACDRGRDHFLAGCQSCGADEL